MVSVEPDYPHVALLELRLVSRIDNCMLEILG